MDNYVPNTPLVTGAVENSGMTLAVVHNHPEVENVGVIILSIYDKEKITLLREVLSDTLGVEPNQPVTRDDLPDDTDVSFDFGIAVCQNKGVPNDPVKGLALTVRMLVDEEELFEFCSLVPIKTYEEWAGTIIREKFEHQGFVLAFVEEGKQQDPLETVWVVFQYREGERENLEDHLVKLMTNRHDDKSFKHMNLDPEVLRIDGTKGVQLANIKQLREE